MFQQNMQNEGVVPQTPETPTVQSAEQQAEEPISAEAPKEISIAQEQPAVSQTPIQTVQTSTSDDTNVPVNQADDAEIEEEFSSNVDQGEAAWAKKAEKVIDQYNQEPYTEEEESEKLQIGYLDSRFGVKINKKEHEIK